MSSWTLKISLVLLSALVVYMIAGAAINSGPVTIHALTLDDRPPNNLLLKQLAAISGIDLVIEFEPESASTADLVSLNAAVAGSLVGSRTADARLLEPPEIRPDALIHFAVPRIEPTVNDIELAHEYQRIRETLQNPDVQRKILAAIRGDESALDDEYMQSYVDRILGWLDFLSRAGYDPDRLLVTLDDNRPGPLSDGIKLLFGEFSHYVYDGTDEGMMLLLARALREKQDPVLLPPTCSVIWTDSPDLVSVQPFESGMPLENWLIMTRWLGLRLSPNLEMQESWRPVVWIHGSIEDETDAENQIRRTVETIGDRPVIVADIAKPNGGDPLLFDTWRTGCTPPGLIGYVGWNTSSNTLGSAMSLWASMDFAYEHGADPEGVRAAAETYLWARFLDDYLYQRVIRPELYEAVRSAGSDPYDLSSEESAVIADAISTMLNHLWTELDGSISFPLRVVDPGDHTTFVVELPWNRLFEIAIYPTDDRDILPVIRPYQSELIND